MCNCINEIVKDVKNKKGALSEHPSYKNLGIEGVFCDISVWAIGAEEASFSIPFTIVHKPVGRKKKTKLNVAAHYCPFCGEKQ